MRKQAVQESVAVSSSVWLAQEQPSFPCSPEGQLLVWCARTTVSDQIRHRIRDAVGQALNWPLFLGLIWFHDVGALVYRTLNAVCPDAVPKDVFDVLRRRTQAGALLNRALVKELAQVCQAFQESGVPVIAFKGASLAVMAYRDQMLRDYGDLDLIVPQHRLVDAQRVLWSQGYRPQDQSKATLDASPGDGPYHLFVKKNVPGYVDLQWVMAHEHFAFQLDRSEIWDRCVPLSIEGKQVMSLSTEDLLIILCVHGSKHAWERLKWVADVAELLRARPVDWQRVFATATKWRCRRMLLMGLALAHRVMNVDLPPDIVRAAFREPDLVELVEHVPKSLLSYQQGCIDEHDGPALYFMLKDGWRDRWRYALAVLRHDHHKFHNTPSWFRWKTQMGLLSCVVDLLRVSVPLNAVKRVRQAIGLRRGAVR